MRWAVVGLTIGLGACGYARRADLEMQPDDAIRLTLEARGESAVCKAAVFYPDLYGPRTVKIARQEAKDMRLGDCSEDHKKCAGMGQEIGTDGYVQCRFALLPKPAEPRQESVNNSGSRPLPNNDVSLELMRQGFQMMNQPPPSPPQQFYISPPSSGFAPLPSTGFTCSNFNGVPNCH